MRSAPRIPRAPAGIPDNPYGLPPARAAFTERGKGENGARDRIRTDDPLDHNQVL